MEGSVGCELAATSASLMLIDRFFFGDDFFNAFSSFLLDSFRSTLVGVCAPLLAFSSVPGVLSESFLVEFFFFNLRGDLASLFFDFFSLSLLSVVST